MRELSAYVASSAVLSHGPAEAPYGPDAATQGVFDRRYRWYLRQPLTGRRRITPLIDGSSVKLCAH